jgi:ABC-type glycerol-3-phosphate transport system substrate-binding protein
MKMIRTIAAFASATALLAACGGGGSDVGKELGLQNPLIHFVHAIPGGPTVDFLVNGSPLQSGIGYKTVTNFANINTGATTVAYANTGTT